MSIYVLCVHNYEFSYCVWILSWHSSPLGTWAKTKWNLLHLNLMKWMARIWDLNSALMGVIFLAFSGWDQFGIQMNSPRWNCQSVFCRSSNLIKSFRCLSVELDKCSLFTHQHICKTTTFGSETFIIFFLSSYYKIKNTKDGCRCRLFHKTFELIQSLRCNEVSKKASTDCHFWNLKSRRCFSITFFWKKKIFFRNQKRKKYKKS